MTATVRFDKWENTASTKSVTMDQIAGGSGLVPIVPSSVTLASGTSSISAGGIVTFSAASSVLLNSVFSDKYDMYKVFYNTTATTNTGWLYHRMGLNGAVQSPAVHNTSVRLVAGTAYECYVASSVTYGWCGRSASALASGETTVINPFAAINTELRTSGNYSTWAGVDASIGIYNTTQYDGISLLTENGTITGTMQVFGIRKA